MLQPYRLSSAPTRRPVVWRRWLSAVLALVLVSWLGLSATAKALATPPDLVAQSIQDLQNKQKNLEQQRNQLQQQQNEIQNRQADSETNLQSLEKNIVYTANQISETEYQLSQAEKELKDFEAQLKKAEDDYEEVRTGTVARLQYLQRQQGSEGWAVLLQSQNFNEFLDRQYQLKRVYAADRQVLADLKARAEAIQKQKAAVEEKSNQVAMLKQQLLSQ
ncbi:peptidase M23, partial [filamentous cyanobacterium CCT1]